MELHETEVYLNWLGNLRDSRARDRIISRVQRLLMGNPGDVRPVGGGVSELRIDYGPGYRSTTGSAATFWSYCLPEATKIPKGRIYPEQSGCCAMYATSWEYSCYG